MQRRQGGSQKQASLQTNDWVPNLAKQKTGEPKIYLVGSAQKYVENRLPTLTLNFK